MGQLAGLHNAAFAIGLCGAIALVTTITTGLAYAELRRAGRH
jgi:hypothetical protein